MPFYTSADADTTAAAPTSVLKNAGTAPDVNDRTYVNLVMDGKKVETAHKPFTCSLGGWSVYML